MPWAVLAVGVLVVAASGGCKRGAPAPGAEGEGAAERLVPVEVVEVNTQTVERTIEVVGTIEASDDVELGAVSTAEVTYVAGDEGDHVSAGQVIIRQDCQDTQASLAQAQAQVTQAKARLEAATKGVALTDAQTGSGVEQAEQALETAQARLEQAKLARNLTNDTVEEGIAQGGAAVEQAKSRLAQAESVSAQTGESTDAGVAQAEAGLASAQAGQNQASAGVNQASAAVLQAEANLGDVRRGARSQERSQAEEAVTQAKLAMDNAKRDLDRIVRLKVEGAVAQTQVDAAQLSYDMATSQHQQAQQRLSLTREGPTAETITAAEQAVAMAKANRDQALAGERLAQASVDQAGAALASARAAQRQKDQRGDDVALARQGLLQAESQLRTALANRIQISTAEREVSAAEAAVLTAESGLRLSKSSRVQVGISEEDVAAARGALDAANAAVRIYQAELDKRVMTSPVDGVIAERKIDPGEVASFGQSLLRIVTADQLYLEATVSELDVGEIKLNQEVAVTVDGVPDQVFAGAVQSILPAGDVASRNFSVKIAMPRNDMVKPGMFGRGKVPVERVENALAIPGDAIIEQRGESHVFVVEGDVAKDKRVYLGLRTRNTVVVNEGLVPGAQVVVVGQQSLGDGTKVKIVTGLEEEEESTGPAPGEAESGAAPAGEGESDTSSPAPPPGGNAGESSAE
jgi:RND family efflux transporter MFP subunit